MVDVLDQVADRDGRQAALVHFVGRVGADETEALRRALAEATSHGRSQPPASGSLPRLRCAAGTPEPLKGQSWATCHRRNVVPARAIGVLEHLRRRQSQRPQARFTDPVMRATVIDRSHPSGP